MRATFDFSPLYRSTVGFDRVARMLEQSLDVQQFDGWPPYDIRKTGTNAYRIDMAVAGFGPQDVELTQEGSKLVVTGRKQPADAQGEYMHRGIAWRDFQHTFSLAEHVEVSGATLVNGLLTVELRREIPEALRPRRIEISCGRKGDSGKTIEHQSAQAA